MILSIPCGLSLEHTLHVRAALSLSRAPYYYAARARLARYYGYAAQPRPPFRRAQNLLSKRELGHGRANVTVTEG
ncbi:hypothetical protein BaRGS_00010769 [Batillaria attramentaria]|uniref:Uncharacterized protein n=1 Tax=Batillaria attramentaria TaxID=370345 RepID=A0ABD0LFK1_9CAEN